MPRDQGKKQNKVGTVEKQQLTITSAAVKPKAEPQSPLSNPESTTPYPPRPNTGAPREPEQTQPKLLLTLTGTKTEGKDHD